MKLSYIQYNETRVNRKGETLVTKIPIEERLWSRPKIPVYGQTAVLSLLQDDYKGLTISATSLTCKRIQNNIKLIKHLSEYLNNLFSL